MDRGLARCEVIRFNCRCNCSNPPSVLDAALTWAAQGHPVLPLYGVDNRGLCTCGAADCRSPGKHPITRSGLKDATTDVATIKSLWSQHPTANVGVRTDRLAVIDTDVEDIAPDAFDVSALPATHTEKTGRGLHFIYNSPGTLTSTKLAPNVDLKAGAGGYIVASPSRHVTGATYSVLRPGPIADWPTIPTESARTVSASRTSSPRKGALKEGERNDGLFRIACSAVRTGVTGEPLAKIVTQSNAAACDPPLGGAEVERIAASAERYVPDEAQGGQKAGAAKPSSPPRPDVQLAPVMLAERFEQVVRPAKKPLIKGLLHERDLGTLAARRRQGKTALLLDAAVAVAAGEPEFCGYEIPGPARVLSIFVEDDEGELQDRLRVRRAGCDLNGRLAFLTREHFDLYDVPIDAEEERFRIFVWAQAESTGHHGFSSTISSSSSGGISTKRGASTGLWDSVANSPQCTIRQLPSPRIHERPIQKISFGLLTVLTSTSTRSWGRRSWSIRRAACGG